MNDRKKKVSWKEGVVSEVVVLSSDSEEGEKSLSARLGEAYERFKEKREERIWRYIEEDREEEENSRAEKVVVY